MRNTNTSIRVRGTSYRLRKHLRTVTNITQYVSINQEMTSTLTRMRTLHVEWFHILLKSFYMKNHHYSKRDQEIGVMQLSAAN